MAIDLLPNQLISKKHLHDINRYCLDIKDKPAIHKYLQEILEEWVVNLENPLEVEWIQMLLSGNAKDMDENFSKLEKHLGEQNLEMIFEELKQGGSRNPEIVNLKIKSISGEITAYNQLVKLGHRNIEKIYEDGDWQSETSIISVKSKQTLDSNYDLLEKTLKGLMLIEENTVLRKYSNVHIENAENVDDNFRSTIIKFLRTSLINTLLYFDSETDHHNHLQTEGIKTFDAYTQQIVKSHSYYWGDRKEIKIEIEQNEPQKDRKITLNFETITLTNDANSIVSIGFDTDGFWEMGQSINEEEIKDKVITTIDKFNRTAHNIHPEQREFIGWLNFPVHAKHEEYINKSDTDFKETLANCRSADFDYKIYICLVPQHAFDLKKQKLFEI